MSATYRYRLEWPHSAQLVGFDGRPAYVGNWGQLIGGTLVINAGYAWDGCSGGVGVFDVSDGDIERDNHDRPQMWEPSLVHDFLYQFEREIREQWARSGSVMGWREFRRIADGNFYRLALAHHFARARLYYWAVRIGGAIAHWKWSRR